MQHALRLAKCAEQVGEVPVGAVLVLDNDMIGEGYNRPISSSDPAAHAEIIALRAGAEKIRNYRLLNTTLYVTLEPCLMCAGAMVHARIQRLVYGAADPKTGMVASRAQVLDLPLLNHQIKHQGGLLAEDCGDILRCFFKARRRPPLSF